MRLLRVLIVLVILALLGLGGYAYLGDMNAAPTEMRVPVQLDLGSAPAATPAAEPAAEAAMTEAPTAENPPPAETGDSID